MDSRDTPQASSDMSAHAPTIAQPAGEQVTLKSGHPFEPEGATPDGSRGTLASHDGDRRDIVAAVIYYHGARALYGDDEAAMREAGVVPPLLGKYPVHCVLGSGGKGAVLLGRNPDLDEEVAIKVLRQDNRDLESESVRLLREGRVLAKLAHPNIVPIHDAGVADGDRYIVMRRVRGASLRDTQRGKTWQQIVDLYVQAGRGLAAVHAAGIVHRDFKADNVLVDADGRVMLADFGLVCLIGDADEHGHRRAAATGNMEAFAHRVTATGEVHGTPAYMAPDAIGGGPSSIRSDLFSFGASLFEALYGVLPFPGANIVALYQAAMEDRVRPRPADAEVPEWLDAVVRRTLRADPTQRQGSIDVLLGELDFRAREQVGIDARHRKVRFWRFVGVGLSAVVTGLFLGSRYVGAEDPCAEPTARVAEIWSAEESARVGRLGEGGLRLAGVLDNYVDTWAHTFATVCNATYTDHTQSSELHDARMACLEQRKRELGAVTGSLEGRPDSSDLDAALLSAAGLDSPGPCVRASRTPQPTEAQASEAAELSQQVAGVRVHELAGDYQESRDLAVALLARARALGYEPLVAEVLLTLGRADWLLGSHEAARAALTEASDLAERHGLDTLAADVANLLTKVAALGLGDAGLGHEWARQAGRKLARIDGDAWRRAELLSNSGLLAFHLDADYPQARALHEQALQQRQALQEAGGEARLLLSESFFNRGTVRTAQDDVAGGIADYQESRRILTELLGPQHPRVGELLVQEAAEHNIRNNLDRALADATDALAIFRGHRGNSGALAGAHQLLSDVQERRHDLEAALYHAQNALAAAETSETPNPDDIALMHDRVGAVRRERGEYALALGAFNDGLTALAAGPNPRPDTELALRCNRGETHVDMGRFDQADLDFAAIEPLIRRGGPALEIYRPYLAKGLARAQIGRGQPAPAVPILEQALAAMSAEADARLRAELEALLVRARTGATGPPAINLPLSIQ